MKKIVDVKNIKKTYDTRPLLSRLFRKPKTDDLIEAVKNVSLYLQSGETLGLIGPNGAGKTTTLKVIAGLLIVDDGEVNVLGENPANLSNSFKKGVALFRGNINMLDNGVVIQDSIEERLSIYGRLRYEKNEFVQEIVEILKAEKLFQATPEKLSQGQRMLVEFVYAICHAPTLILLDEPTNGLDIVAIQYFAEVLDFLKKKYSAGIIITSHNLNNIVSLADRIVLINKGEVELEGTTENILKEESGERRIEIDIAPGSNIPKKQITALAKRVLIDTSRITIYTNKTDIKQVLIKILEVLPVTDIRIVEPPIEQIFAKYYKSPQ